MDDDVKSLSRLRELGTHLLTTPKRRLTVALFAAALYLSWPVVITGYFFEEQAQSAYPHDGDAIAIGIYAFARLWLWASPIYILLVWLALRHYPGRISLGYFNRARPYWSAVWTLLLISLSSFYIAFAIEALSYRHFIFALHLTLTALLILVLRCSVVNSRLFYGRRRNHSPR